MNNEMLIAVLMGGSGSEREVSLASGRAVLTVLKAEGMNAVGVEAVDREPRLPTGTGLVFNVIHGIFGEDGGLQEYLEGLGIPYTGAGVESSRLAFDKVESKRCFERDGIPTPASEVVDCSTGVRIPAFQFPFVVKPPKEGSSVGVHIVRTAEEAGTAMEDAAKYGNEVLVEQFVEGKELTVGVLDGQALPVVHIQPRDGFYDMNNKYPWMTEVGGTDYFCPADLTETVTKRVQEAALKAHHSLGVEIYSRVDVLLDSSENPYVLEVNTIPGMTESSLLPKAAAAAGYPFGKLCQKVAELSYFLRNRSNG